MDTNKILSADLLDLIFDDRNKDYGAYELRKTYQRRITKSLLFTGLFVALTCTGVVLANKPDPKVNGKVAITTVSLEDIKPDDKKPEPLPPPPPPQPEPLQVQTEQLTQITVVDDDQVEEPLPTQEDLATSKIGLADIAGVADEGISTPPNLDEGKGVIEQQEIKEPDIWTKVEIDAKFDGNWSKFLLQHLDGQTAIENNAPPGLYTVVIQFVVDIDGSLSDLTPLTKHGYGLEEEAMRVIKKSKKWEPAIQNGRQVKAYRKQPITFQVADE